MMPLTEFLPLSRCQDLLEKARSCASTSDGVVMLKKEFSLPANKGSDDTETLPPLFQSKLELALRACLDSASKTLSPTTSIRTSALASILHLSVKLAQLNLIGEKLPLLLLEDILICRTIEECATIFEFVEDVINDIAKVTPDFSKSKLVVLKICSGLLARVPRTQHTVFRGRVLMLLARVMPVDERSGLNLNAYFNRKNDTEFESHPPTPMTDKLDFAFYSTFWSMQTLLRDPIRLNESASLQQLLNSIKTVLTAFEAKTLTSADAVAQAQVEAEHVSYSAKYLTSSRLLDLQLRDPYLRLQILSQLLITLQYMLEGCTKVPVTLTPAQREDVQKVQKRVQALLLLTPPDGDKFVADVNLHLLREQNWSLWKDDGCKPNIEFAPTSAVKATAEAVTQQQKKQPKKRRIFGVRAVSDEPYEEAPMGKPELVRLWKLDVDLTSAERKFEPSMKPLLEKVLEQDDPEADIEECYKVKNDPKFSWKVLRGLARTNIRLFESGDLGKAAERLLKKKANKQAAAAAAAAATATASSGAGAERSSGADDAAAPDVESTTAAEVPAVSPRTTHKRRRQLSNGSDVERESARLAKRKMTERMQEKARQALHKEKEKMKTSKLSENLHGEKK